MLEFLRRQQSWLMIIIAIIIIIAFAWLYDPNRGALENPDIALRLYGKDYRQSDVQEIARSYQTAQLLQLNGMTDVLARADQRFSRSGEGVPDDFIVNLIVLREEAAKHGISFSDEEIEKAIKNLPIFQNNGAYDPTRWNMLKGILEQRGLDTRNIYTTVGDNLVVEEALALFTAGIRPSATEIEKAHTHIFSTIEGSAYTLERANFETGVEATAEEIRQFYEENVESLLTNEQRRVDYVHFPAPEGLETLSTEERLEKEKAFNRMIQDYSSAVVAEYADFDAITRERNLIIKATPLFSSNNPPENLKGKNQLIAAIFDSRRNLEDPVSDPVPVDGGTYIFRLAEIVDPAPMKLADAKAMITRQVIEDKIDTALRDAAQKARDAVVAGIESGADATTAATNAGATRQEVGSFQLGAPPNASPNGQIIARIAAELEAGEVSQVAPTATGALFYHCTARAVTNDPEHEQHLADLTEQISYTDRRLVFNSWFQSVKDAAGLEH